MKLFKFVIIFVKEYEHSEHEMVDTMEHISLRLKCKWMPNELLITECIGDRLWTP